MRRVRSLVTWALLKEMLARQLPGMEIKYMV